jgi:peptidoglycan/xylan/chitin deacetylase (PgdA/CDA1 family)
MTQNRETGTFVFSLDTELAWGSVHHGGYANHEKEFDRTRYVVDRLLELFESYGIHGTWAVVGKLMLDAEDLDPPITGEGHSLSGTGGYSWRRDGDDHFWHGRDIVDRISSCAVTQEIGSHNYTHMIMGMPGSTAERFDHELKSCKAVAQERHIDLKSFVYPRNEIDHIDVLGQNGFTSYRGVAPSWTWRVPGGTAKRLARLADHFLPIPAPVVTASMENGVVNIPASYSYLHRSGWARYIPISIRVRKSILTMRKAASSAGIFHLWTHPFNIASDPGGLLGGLERIFQEYKRLHDSGLIVSRTMSEVAEQVSNPVAAKAEKSYASS